MRIGLASIARYRQPAATARSASEPWPGPISSIVAGWGVPHQQAEARALGSAAPCAAETGQAFCRSETAVESARHSAYWKCPASRANASRGCVQRPMRRPTVRPVAVGRVSIQAGLGLPQCAEDDVEDVDLGRALVGLRAPVVGDDVERRVVDVAALASCSPSGCRCRRSVSTTISMNSQVPPCSWHERASRSGR